MTSVVCLMAVPNTLARTKGRYMCDELIDLE